MFPYQILNPTIEPELSLVDVNEIKKALNLARQLPCTELRCRNASETGNRTCVRCVVVATLASLAGG